MNRVFHHKFHVKRNYNKYHLDEEVVNEVFEKFEDPAWNLSDISRASNIPFHTIQQWYAKYRENKDYRPGKLIGQHKRYFTTEQEEDIVQYIRENYIQPGKGVKRKHLRLVIFKCWQQQDIENRGTQVLTKKCLPTNSSIVSVVGIVYRFEQSEAKKEVLSQRKKWRSLEKREQKFLKTFLQIVLATWMKLHGTLSLLAGKF